MRGRFHPASKLDGFSGDFYEAMLGILGLKEDGTVEIFSFRPLGKADYYGSWRSSLVDLKSRGVLCQKLKIITADVQPGLLKAVRWIYPLLKTQRQIARNLRNVTIK